MSGFEISNGILTKYLGCESNVVIPNGVTEIESNAFFGCKSLISLTIPCSVKRIGYSAFYRCDNLTAVNYLGSIDGWVEIKFESDDSNPVYNENAKLYVNDSLVTSVNLSVANKVSSYAFCGCSDLTSVIIGESATEVGMEAFSKCVNLSNIIIGNKVTHIAEKAFNECKSLTAVTLPSSVYGLGQNVFNYCDNLISVTLLEGLVHISNDAFNECNKLTSVIIPSSVEYIGEKAFRNCSNLTVYLRQDCDYEEYNSKWNGDCPVVYNYKG